MLSLLAFCSLIARLHHMRYLPFSSVIIRVSHDIGLHVFHWFTVLTHISAPRSYYYLIKHYLQHMLPLYYSSTSALQKLHVHYASCITDLMSPLNLHKLSTERPAPTGTEY